LVNEIEKYGSGYVRIREVIRNYPGMKFDFEEKGDGFLVVLSYQQQKISLVNGGLNGGLNEKQEKVLKYIIQNPNSKVKDMSVALSIPIGTMEKYIRFLVKTSLIERRGSKKTGGYYKI
jgi:ATP-dependent DNA helicase RecG